MTAFILLGANTGIGNADIARMEHQHVDLESGWLNYPRGKTEVKRRAKLWPETCDAVREVMESPDEIDLVFLTKPYNNPWSNEESSQCSLSRSFTELTKRLDLYRKGRGFYGLRRGFETVAGESRDQAAVDHVMGHDNGSMANEYRERISDERLEDVAGVVHKWLFGSP